MRTRMLASVLISLTACALVISPAATAAAPASHSAAKKVTWKHPAVTSKPMSAADAAALQSLLQQLANGATRTI